MARLRKFSAYRKLERPYTRVSKFRTKSYVRARPNCRIVRFNMGDLTSDFDYTLLLKSKADLQIRDNAIEAARQTSNRLVVKKMGKQGFRLRVRCFPHHVLRENPLASGAGADRMSTGMKKSFGKSIGIAAQIKKGQVIFELNVPKAHLATGREALRRAGMKLPCGTSIEVIDNTQKKKAAASN